MKMNSTDVLNKGYTGNFNVLILHGLEYHVLYLLN